MRAGVCVCVSGMREPGLEPYAFDKLIRILDFSKNRCVRVCQEGMRAGV